MNKICLLLFLLGFLSASCSQKKTETTVSNTLVTEEAKFVVDFKKAQVISSAEAYLLQAPVPITANFCKRSAGGIHDFYSEGDYWWPNPDDPTGPYIRRDGKTNPDNFTAHRQAMRDLNRWVSALVAAYKITGETKYAGHAIKHLNAFFLDVSTRMNPNLLYAQAINGRVTGRGIGIIDTIHLIEVAKAIEYLVATGILPKAQELGLKEWFSDYANWMNTHEYGLAEKDHGNNHSTWWAAQVAAFAHLTENTQLMTVAREQGKKLLSAQMAEDGGFPEELERTKPYNYSLFNLEGYAIWCELASSEQENLWYYEGEHGSIQQAWDFMLPYIKDKSTWPKAPDIQYFDQLPIQTPGLLLAAIAYQEPEYFAVWQQLNPERKSDEVNRNYPIREPLLWYTNPEKQ